MILECLHTVQKVESPDMAYRIVGHRIEPKKSLSPDALRREFETAVCELHDLDPVAQKRRLQYRTPDRSTCRAFVST